FRKVITPGNFIFSTREFEQMEIEFFLEEKEYEFWFNYFMKKIQSFLELDCNINKELISIHEHDKSQLSHYSKRTIDFNFDFPHGPSELWGLAYRTDFDLKNHSLYSKKDLSYLDSNSNEKFIPHVIEPSVGVERLLYAICCSCYEEQKLDDDTRIVMHLPYKLSPYKVAILPLVNKLKDKAEEIWDKLLEHGISCTFDTSGSIGKRYRRQDAIGTPYCLTIDFDTIDTNIVTIRDRDTMEQIKLNVDEILDFFLSKL
ncbi:MAG: glycine--tRNA ligase, partial [Ureaplasma sp.]|nr:glycine--tRNA ligase [Ureaplasma sp.]